jgi:hypothetical protein
VLERRGVQRVPQGGSPPLGMHDGAVTDTGRGSAQQQLAKCSDLLKGGGVFPSAHKVCNTKTNRRLRSLYDNKHELLCAFWIVAERRSACVARGR